MTEPIARWARTLQEQRMRAGITQREFARRLGVAQETVRAAEMGHSPRHSTLMTFLDRIPGLQPHALLSGRDAPPVVTEASWSAYERLFGFSARRCEWNRTKVDGGFRDIIVVYGLRLVAPELEGLAARLGLARAVCAGSDRFLSALTLHAFDGTQEVVEGENCHRFSFRTVKGRTVLDYCFSGIRGSDSAMSLPLGYCARQLEMAYLRPTNADRSSLALTVRPVPIPEDGAEERLAYRMHPQVKWRSSAYRVACRITHPMPGFVYKLAESSEPLDRPAPTWTLARTLKAARDEAGLSLRAVADVAGTSPATLLYAEAGRDPRASTLEGYLRALPNLAPQDLLPKTGSGGLASFDEVWELMRGLYGYEVGSITKTVLIDSEGNSKEVIDTWALRSLRSDLRDLRVRTAYHRAITRASQATLQEIESDLSETKVRRIRREDGSVQHEILFPARLERGAISYSRTYSGPRFPLSRRLSQLLNGRDDVLVSGVALPIYHPARRVFIRVRFATNFRPRAVTPIVLPTCVPADTPMPVLSRDLVVPPIRVRLGRVGTELSLGVARPLVGTTFAISWEVPD